MTHFLIPLSPTPCDELDERLPHKCCRSVVESRSKSYPTEENPRGKKRRRKSTTGEGRGGGTPFVWFFGFHQYLTWDKGISWKTS